VNPSHASGSIEDHRQASSLATSLSTYVATATLALLGAQAVIATFVVDKRTHLLAFYVVSGFAAAALILSIIFGGLGAYELISAGRSGDWRISTRHRKFNVQSLLALIGALLVVLSAFLGDAKPG
jgi:predicted NodU family carbamoyl transferase